MNDTERTVAQNKKAYHDYFVEETYEAGLELYGTEVKSIRQGTLNLKDAWCGIKNGELIISSVPAQGLRPSWRASRQTFRSMRDKARTGQGRSLLCRQRIH